MPKSLLAMAPPAGAVLPMSVQLMSPGVEPRTPKRAPPPTKPLVARAELSASRQLTSVGRPARQKPTPPATARLPVKVQAEKVAGELWQKKAAPPPVKTLVGTGPMTALPVKVQDSTSGLEA